MNTQKTTATAKKLIIETLLQKFTVDLPHPVTAKDIIAIYGMSGKPIAVEFLGNSTARVGIVPNVSAFSF